MSDKEILEAQKDIELSQEEVAAQLKTVIQGTAFSGTNYVADPAPGWDVDGVWSSFATDFRSGYSVAAMAATYALSDGFSLPTQLVPHRHMDIDPDRFPADRRALYDKWHEGKVGRAHMLVASYPPIESAYLKDIAKYIVCYTVSEATRISAYTVNLCNEHFSEIWVMSDFCRRAFVESGVRADIVRTVPPMLYGGPWRQTFATEKHTGPYLFGTQGTWHARKGMLDLVRAYYGAFDAKDDVLLEIRTSQMGGRQLTIKELETKIGNEIRAVRSEFQKSLPQIALCTGTDKTDQEVLDGLRDLDCYVNPSYGEGVGIPPIWAAMAGVPVVTSTFGAPGEYFAKRASPVDRLVPHCLARVDPSMPSLNRIYDFDQEWGHYSIDEFGAAMRSVYEAGRSIDSGAAERTRIDFGLPQMMTAMRPALEKFLPTKMLEAK